MQMKCQCEQQSHLSTQDLDLRIRSALSQGSFLQDALQAPVCQDTTLVPLLKLDHGHSSFTSSGKGSEVRGRFLYSLLFLKPWLQKQQKNPFHSWFFFSWTIPLFLFTCTIFLVCIERKVYSGRESILKMRKTHTQLWGRSQKVFQVELLQRDALVRSTWICMGGFAW